MIQQIVFFDDFFPPERSWSRHGRDQAPKTVQNGISMDFFSNFDRFEIDLGWFVDDFSTIFDILFEEVSVLILKQICIDL